MQDLINLAVHLGLRFGKAIVLGLVMYFSLKGLGFSSGASFAAAMVPFALGAINIFTGPVFALTGIAFIVSSAVALLQDKGIDTSIKPEDAKNVMQSVGVGVESAVKSAAQAASSVAAAATTAAINANAAATETVNNNATLKAATELPGKAATAAVNKATSAVTDKGAAPATAAAAPKPAASAAAPAASAAK